MNNKLFAIVLSVMLSLPISVWAVDDLTVNLTSLPTANTLDDDAVGKGLESDNQYKQPISKRKIAKKFLAAMGGVAVSSFAIFFLLTVYNRIRENYVDQVHTPEGETSLETPDDINGAIKTFLEKTNWRS